MDQINNWLAENLDVVIDMSIVKVVGIVAVAWLLAAIIGVVVRRVLLNHTPIDGWINDVMGAGSGISASRWGGRITFWLVFLLGISKGMEALNPTSSGGPLDELLNPVMEFAPRLLVAVLLLAVGWIVGVALKKLVAAALDKTGIDERLSSELMDGDSATRVPVSRTLGETVQWLVMLLFLPAVLGALKIESLLEPLQAMLSKLLAFLPNLLSAAIIFILGWVVARLVQRVVSNLLAAAGADQLSERVGVGNALGNKRLSDLIGLIVHAFIIIPVGIAALGALKIDAITRPASQMLTTLLSALPLLFAAGLVLVVSFFIGKVVAELVSNLLAGAGFDNILNKVGVTKSNLTGSRNPSSVGGDVVMIAIMLFAFVEASNLLGFGTLSGLTSELMQLGGRILLGLVILALGLFLANAASDAIENSGIQQSRILSMVAKVSVIVLAGAMGLRQMGLANEIITTAFTLTLGAVAVAFAIAFGIGGRDEAGEQVKEWRAKLKSKK